MKRVLFLLLALSLSVMGCKKDQQEPAKSPSVSTGAVSAITKTSFDCEGSVSSDGGAAVTDRGVCYAMSSAPTISNNKVSGGSGTGSFKVSVSGLESGKVYYARAYATNSVGTAYGQEVKVTLLKAIEGITVTPSEKSVEAGEKFKLQVTFTPDDVPNKSVTWSSNKSDVASVDSQGEVTTHKEGTAIITATAVDGGKRATCRVTVRRKIVAVTGITVSPAEKSLDEGESFVVTATVLPADADNKEVTWSSSAGDVASVNNQGRVTAHKPGSAIITATTVDGGKTATCRVTVTKKVIKVTGITVFPTEKTIKKGESFTITATVLPADADNKEVTWSSSAADVASVNNQGGVTAHKPGSATITATTVDGGKTATCRVTVREEIKVTGITVSPTEKSLTEGESFTIIASVLPADADNKSVTWSSSASDIASVNDQGKVTAHKAGKATITATTADGGKTATCQVTVKSKITEEYKALKKKAEEIDKKIDAAKKELDGIKKSNKTVNEKRQLMEAFLQKIESIKSEINSLNAEIEAKKDLLHKKEYDELKEKIRSLMFDIAELQTAAEIYKQKLDKAAREGKGDISDLDIVDL